MTPNAVSAPLPPPLPGLPGGIDELERHFDQHGLSAQARKIVQQIVRGNPARRVAGGRKNAVVRYASRKLGRVIQAESRTVDAAFVQFCEFTPEVVLYLCQPWILTVPIVDSRERHTSIHTVVDFLVLDSAGFRFVECKSPSELRRYSECKHPRFVRDRDRWRWPAAEQAASALGLGFELFTSEDVNIIWLRNMRFLADYVHAPSPCDPTQLQEIQNSLTQQGSIRICHLLASTGLSPAALWWLVAHGHIFCDLERERLFETDQAWAHSSEARMLAQRHCDFPSGPSSEAVPPTPAQLQPGARLFWDDVPWTVLNLGTKSVTLQHADAHRVITLPNDEAQKFLRDGHWRAARSALAAAQADSRNLILNRASDRDLSDAHRRHAIVLQYLQHAEYPPHLNPRVVRRYLRWHKDGEQRHGSGFVGLIRFRGRPRGIPRLPEPQRQVLEEVTADFANKGTAGRVAAAHARIVGLCRERGIKPPPCAQRSPHFVT